MIKVKVTEFASVSPFPLPAGCNERRAFIGIATTLERDGDETFCVSRTPARREAALTRLRARLRSASCPPF
ncbi:hypothetical protein KQI65_03110 [bacterium]|nr:hypothetical protein [bacterium]